jgi:hypothetical protein
MSSSATSLPVLIPDLAQSDPSSFQGIWEAPYGSLSETAQEIRRNLVDFRNGLDQPPVLTPEDVASRLTAGHLRPLPKGWLAVPLGTDRRRVLTPIITHDATREAAEKMASTTDPGRALRHALTRPGAVRWSWAAHPQRRVPTAKVLTETGFCPDGGTWFLVYGGSPDVLDTPGVTKAIVELSRGVALSDVLFWHRQSGVAPVCFSVGAGAGDRSGTTVPFPNPDAAEQLRTELIKSKGGKS